MNIIRNVLTYVFCGSVFSAVADSLPVKTYEQMPYIIDMVHNNPGEKPYDTKYNSPSYLRSQGFNGSVTHWHINCAIDYDNFEKGLVPYGSDERKWIENKAKLIDEKLKEFEAEGINTYPFTDFLVFPKSIWEKYGDELRGNVSVTEKSPKNKPDIRSKMTQKLLRAQIEGIFNRFPDIDGITLRFGETYLHDTPFHLGNSPIRSGEGEIEDHILLINIFREEICVKRNKKLFYRTWDFGYKFHNNPKFYLSVTNSVETHPNLIFSIKYQQDDYHRMTPFNPALGIGKHQQIVEAQSRMEAYGKGAHPYYTSKGVIEGWPETKYVVQFGSHRQTSELNPEGNPRGVRDVLDSGLIKGVMTWSHGGGWQGPYISHEIWTDLNTYVLSKWAINPNESEEKLFADFAASKGITGKNADMFRNIALLSVDGVLKGHCNTYVSNDVWWTRDEFFCARSNIRCIDEMFKEGVVDKVLAEKAESVAIWERIEAISKQMDLKDKELQEAIEVSSSYGRIKYSLIEQMWILMIEDARIRKGAQPDKKLISDAIARYDELWSEWRNLKESSKYCATIYTELAFRNQYEGSIKELVTKMREY